jgi:hypothetical protein
MGLPDFGSEARKRETVPRPDSGANVLEVARPRYNLGLEGRFNQKDTVSIWQIGEIRPRRSERRWIGEKLVVDVQSSSELIRQKT